MNKKATSTVDQELIIWIPRLIILIIATGIILFLITNAIQKSFETDKVQQSILRQRFVYSEDCLAYKDDKVNPGIIDEKKFTQRNLENCFQSHEELGVNINLITNEVKTVNLNDNLKNKFNFCFDQKHFSCSNYTYYVLIKDNENYKPGLLNVAMIKLK